MNRPKQESNPARTKKVISFLRDGFNDYIASRVLLLNKLPQQAAILSSTAIEKCIKAMLAMRGHESHGHLKIAHWNYVSNFDRTLHDTLDREFIALNQRAYQLRYTDTLPLDFNLVIASREFLAELDHTVSSIFSRFSLAQNGRTIETVYAAALRQRESRVVDENHVVNSLPKQSFILLKPQFVYEIRNDPTLGLFEITYDAVGPPKRRGFGRDALVRLEDNGRMTYSLAFGESENASSMHH